MLWGSIVRAFGTKAWQRAAVELQALAAPSARYPAQRSGRWIFVAGSKGVSGVKVSQVGLRVGLLDSAKEMTPYKELAEQQADILYATT